MAKDLPPEYVPSNPPTLWSPRWIFDEFQRIARRFRDNPVLFVIRVFAAPVDISPVPTAIRLGVGAVPTLDFPGGDWDDVTATWTCPLDGIYMLTASVEIAPFGTGNKAYQADIVMFRDGIEAGRAVDSAVDDVPLSVNLISPISLEGGSEIHLDLVTVHAQFTGATVYDYDFSLVRLGGIS